MEQMFRRHHYAFFLEFKQFSFHFTKATTSFLKLSWEILRLTVFLLRSLGHLFFVGPSLYLWHSPTQSCPVERNTPVYFPRKF
jgi:hypothetical protein